MDSSVGLHWPQHLNYRVDLSSVNLIVIAAASLGIWLWWYRWSQRHKLGPKEWPLIGILIEAHANWGNIHDIAASYLRKISTCRISLGFGVEMLLTADPDCVEHIMKTNFSNYPKGPRITAANHDFFGQGIFNADGDLWRHQRKVASIEFASSRLRNFSTNIFREYALRLASILRDKAHSSSQGQFNLQDLLSRMTLDTTVNAAFGVDLNCLAPSLPELPVAKSYDTASACSFLRFVDPLWRVKRFLKIGSEKQLKQAVQVLDDFAYDIIRRRRQELPQDKGTEKVNEEEDDLLSRFVKLSTQGDSRFGDRALRDIMINYILAGRDSTSAVLCWLVYMLCLHPEVVAKIRAELFAMEQRHPSPEKHMNKTEEEVFRDFAELLTFDNVGSLTYLHAAVTETMRLYPPVPMNAKHALEDDILPDGTKVNKGSFVAFNAYAMGRLEDLWGPDAAEFKPERWIKDGVFQPESPFKYIAFQGGPRLCLGKDSSYLQMKLTAALICQFFDFHLVPGHVVTYRTMISLVMLHGLKVTVTMAEPSRDK